MCGLLAHLAEVVERCHDPPPKMVMPHTVRNHASCEGIVSRNQPFGQRAAPPRRMTVSRRNLYSRVAVSNHTGKACLHLRTAALIVSMKQKIRRRRFVVPRTRVKKTALDGL